MAESDVYPKYAPSQPSNNTQDTHSGIIENSNSLHSMAHKEPV